MIHKRWLFLLCGLVGLALLVSPVEAKVVTIPNFAMDPSGLDYEIVAIGPTQGLSHNIVAPPELKYGQTSVPDGRPIACA